MASHFRVSLSSLVLALFQTCQPPRSFSFQSLFSFVSVIFPHPDILPSVMLQVLDLNVNPAHASAHSSALSGSPLGTSEPRPSSITNLILPWEGSLTDDQAKDRSSNESSPAPLPATTSDSHPPTTAIASTTGSTPMLLRSSSSTSSVPASSSYSSGLATASSSKHHDKRAGAATAATSSSSSSSSAYRPTHLHLDQARSFKSTSPPKSPHRAYHGEQSFTGLPSPPAPALGNDSVPDIYCRGTYLLPCPPTSPTGRRTRFRLNQYQSNLRRTVGWVKDRLQAMRSTASMLQMRRSPRQDHRPHPSKHTISHTRQGLLSPAFWVVLYFTLNLSLTLYNKYVLIHFPFPYTLTALHALCGTVGTSFMLHLGGMGKISSPSGEDSGKNGIRLAIPNLALKETVVVLLFSLLYTVNIVVSNASLKLVTVPVSAKHLIRLTSTEHLVLVPSGRSRVHPLIHHRPFCCSVQ